MVFFMIVNVFKHLYFQSPPQMEQTGHRQYEKEERKTTRQLRPAQFLITQHKDIRMLKKTRQSSHYKMTKKLCICSLIFLYFIIYN